MKERGAVRYRRCRPGRSVRYHHKGALVMAGCLLLSCVNSDSRRVREVQSQTRQGAGTYDLKQVAGIEHFPQDPGLRKLLAQNGFVVVPRQHRQIFSPYVYNDPPYLPVFITLDSAFRTYQVLLQEGLRLIERAQATRLAALSSRLLGAVKALEVGPDPLWEQTRLKLLAWAAVGLRLQKTNRGFEDLPEGARQLAVAEWRSIKQGGVAAATILKRTEPVHYGHLEPTGFYAQEELLAGLFRAVKWYGLTSFRIDSEHEAPCALLLASTVAGDPKLLAMIRAFMEPYDALLGPPDDVGVLKAVQVLASLPQEMPHKQNPPAYAAVLPAFRTAMNALPKPRINDQILDLETYVTDFDRVTHGLRLLPPRYTWEAHLGTELGRKGPGLLKPFHVSMALGDSRSEIFLRRTDDAVAVDLAKRRGADYWRSAPSSLYTKSLTVLSKVFDPPPKEAPPFAHTDAWKTKSTWTCLAGWTCLRHLWELHAKELVEILGFVEGLEPAGYVSPYPSVFTELGELARQTDSVLASCGAYDTEPVTRKAEGYYIPSPKDVKDRLGKYAELMDRLAAIARKQLRGEAITEDENKLLFHYGGRLGHLHFYPSTMYMVPYDDMPQAVLYVTDATGDPIVEHYAAVGRALEMYVILDVPPRTVVDPTTGRKKNTPGGLRLHRGATFSFYDFAQPTSTTRLTDVQWRELLDSDHSPDFPAWAFDFMLPIRASNAERLRAGEYIKGIEQQASPELTEAAQEGYFKARATGKPFYGDSGDGHLRVLLAGIKPENAELLIDLAPRINNPRHVRLIAEKFRDEATAGLKERLPADAATGHPNLLVLAWHTVDKSLPLEALKATFGGSTMGRWALAAALGWLPETSSFVELYEVEFGDEDEEDDTNTVIHIPPVEIEPTKVNELLRLALKDEAYVVRAQAMHSLKRAPRTKALPVLRKGLGDPSPAVRTFAAMSLLAHDDTQSEPLMARTLWYIDDPVNRRRTLEEGTCLADRQEYLGCDPALTIYDRKDISYLANVLLFKLTGTDPGSWLAAYAAAKYVENPRVCPWGVSAEHDTRRCWQRLLVSIATDRGYPRHDRYHAFLTLRFAKSDRETAQALAHSLDDEAVLGDKYSAASLAAQIILEVVEGGDTAIPLETAEDRQRAVQRAREALDELGLMPEDPDEEWQADLEKLYVDLEELLR